MKKFTKLWNAVKIPLLAILCSLVAGGVIIAVTGSESSLPMREPFNTQPVRWSMNVAP